MRGARRKRGRMNHTILFFVLGYLSGSILFAQLMGRLMGKDVFGSSADQNPGTFNAFRYGGFWCGFFTLCGDLLKGFLPVWLYLHAGITEQNVGLAFVLFAPVMGHIFPVFYGFKGGKGIAVSFGCLLGLLPEFLPVVILAAVFLFFSLILKITPHYYRTICTYIFSAILMKLLMPDSFVFLGFLMIAGLIILKLCLSTEKKEKFEVNILWKH